MNTNDVKTLVFDSLSTTPLPNNFITEAIMEIIINHRIHKIADDFYKAFIPLERIVYKLREININWITTQKQLNDLLIELHINAVFHSSASGGMFIFYLRYDAHE